MSIKVKPNHPVMEEIARILSGIGSCPSLQQMKMVNEAAKRAALRVDEAEARAVKAEAELKDCARAIEIRDRDGMAALRRAEKAEAELYTFRGEAILQSSKPLSSKATKITS